MIPTARVLALSPGTLVDAAGPAFARAAGAAVEAGLDAIVLREPGLSDRAFLACARLVRERLGAAGWLCVHDRVHLAPAADADAVHLGWRSLPPAIARALLPARIAVGFSAHAHDDADARAGADYLTFGPVLETPSKAGRLAPTGFDGLARAVRDCALPVWALGGLRPEHVAPVLAAGASGVAVLGGIFGSSDPAAAVRRYLAALGPRPPARP